MWFLRPVLEKSFTVCSQFQFLSQVCVRCHIISIFHTFFPRKKEGSKVTYCHIKTKMGFFCRFSRWDMESSKPCCQMFSVQEPEFFFWICAVVNFFTETLQKIFLFLWKQNSDPFSFPWRYFSEWLLSPYPIHVPFTEHKLLSRLAFNTGGTHTSTCVKKPCDTLWTGNFSPGVWKMVGACQNYKHNREKLHPPRDSTEQT